MARTSFQSVDEYIASQAEPVHRILARVRSAIRKAVPQAQETISYNIPTYKLHTRPVLYFAAWKRHFSIYPASERVIAEFQDDLAPYEVQKGTIRIPLSQPVPVKLIGHIAKFRANEIAAREKAKAAAPKGR